MAARNIFLFNMTLNSALAKKMVDIISLSCNRINSMRSMNTSDDIIYEMTKGNETHWQKVFQEK